MGEEITAPLENEVPPFLASELSKRYLAELTPSLSVTDKVMLVAAFFQPLEF